MSKKRTLMEEVLAEIPRKGFKPWHHDIPADLRAECEGLRAAFWSGAMGSKVTKTGLSQCLAKSLQARGVHIGHSGVAKWLEDGRPKA